MADLEDYRREQKEVAAKVVLKDDFGKIRLICAADQISTNRHVVSGVVVVDKENKVIESSVASIETETPYIPYFLYYREGPAFIKAFKNISKKPDLLLVKGNGILHPTKCGMATHLGVNLDIPTIGIAKTLLTGKVNDIGEVIVRGEVRAKEIKTRTYSNPLYVSQGHKISLESAEKIVRELIIPPHKLPEPLHKAHKFANKLKKEILANELTE